MFISSFCTVDKFSSNTSIFFSQRGVGMCVIYSGGTERTVAFISSYRHQNNIFCVANIAWKYNVHTKKLKISNVALYVIFTSY